MKHESARQWLPGSAAVAHLDAHRVVHVSGPDARALLQGQFSNDIDALDEKPGQLSSYNSPKGRVLAFLRIVKLADDYRLVVDADIHDVFVQRLKMFVLRAKVSIESDPGFAGNVVAGSGAIEYLRDAGFPDVQPGEAAAHGNCVWLGIHGPVPRIEIHGPRESLPELDIPHASAEDLARWDVIFRLPRIMEGNRDAHVAQHLNLDELGAINFKKGCYTGQEIIARMKYLGKVKKRSAIFMAEGVNVGDSVRTNDDRGAGDVVNVAAAGNGRQLVLATVSIENAEASLAVNGKSLIPLAV